MRIAIFGDIHGDWAGFRDAIARLHRQAPLDLVLQVGDAMPVRDTTDLSFTPVPAKHRKLGSFAQIKGPWPVATLMIGGNHEPWNRLDAMPEGGPLLPNLDYLGRAGVREWAGLRLAWVSGIYSPRWFDCPRRAWPYGPERAKEAGYFRREDLEPARKWGRADIMLMHPWPTQLESGVGPEGRRPWVDVGVQPLGDLVRAVRPRFVFCGHMHHPGRADVDGTCFVALDAFNERPGQAVAILEGPPEALAMVNCESL